MDLDEGLGILGLAQAASITSAPRTSRLLQTITTR
jgi:hypothetical protein